MRVAIVGMEYFYMSDEDFKASVNPLIVMVDEETGEKYCRATGRKGLGTDGTMDRLVKDMVEELRTWGHAGGAGSLIIWKRDNNNAVKALDDAVGKLMGGKVIPENPPQGTS